MSLKADMLDAFADVDLRAVIARAEELLKQHDNERKDKAMAEARATLAAVGLSLKDLSGRGHKSAKGHVYRGGQVYRHPTNKALTWAGKGKKPGWLVTLEAEGGKAVEAANDNIPPALKKAG
jgi:DNA-binding protein H-NS